LNCLQFRVISLSVPHLSSLIDVRLKINSKVLMKQKQIWHLQNHIQHEEK